MHGIPRFRDIQLLDYSDCSFVIIILSSTKMRKLMPYTFPSSQNGKGVSENKIILVSSEELDYRQPTPVPSVEVVEIGKNGSCIARSESKVDIMDAIKEVGGDLEKAAEIIQRNSEIC